MGKTVCEAVRGAGDMDLVAQVDPEMSTQCGAMSVAEVAVDFTVGNAARDNLRWCAANGVHAVVGTSGFTDADFTEFGELFEKSDANAIIVPNFAIGAVLMMRFAELAAPFFETAEIIELHHNQKIDAPSGTAMDTARRMAAASKDWSDDPTTAVNAEGARGGRVDNI